MEQKYILALAALVVCVFAMGILVLSQNPSPGIDQGDVDEPGQIPGMPTQPPALPEDLEDSGNGSLGALFGDGVIQPPPFPE